MDAHLVVQVLSHQSDPVTRREQVDKEHDQEKLHQWVLVRVQETKAVDEGYLALDQQMGLAWVERFLWS